MISPEAMAIAERHAAEDLALLARLQDRGLVKRVGPENGLTRRVDRLRVKGLDTIRPNKKRQKGKRR